MIRRTRAIAAAVIGVALLASCATSSGDTGAGGGSKPHIVVTTSILGDVVEHLVGSQADVQVIMPPGAEPHEFDASARDGIAMHDADVLVVNGLGFEGGLTRQVDAAHASGTDVYDASSAIRPLRAGTVLDPHFFTDPRRMAQAAAGIAAHLRSALPALRTAAFTTTSNRYLTQLRAADAAIEARLAAVPAARRRLVTNHEVFSYFADRYGFRVVGAIVPSLSPQAEPSAKGLEALARTIRAERVPAIFVDTSSTTRLADKLAADAGVAVEVVPLYSESLGPKGSPGATYIGMMTTNADRIARALGPGA